MLLGVDSMNGAEKSGNHGVAAVGIPPPLGWVDTSTYPAVLLSVPVEDPHSRQGRYTCVSH